MEQQVKIREAVGVFDDQDKLDAAIAELESTAFPRQDISVLGTGKEVEEKYGADSVKPERIEDNPFAPRGISVRPEEKTIGAAFIAGICAYVAGCAAALAVARTASGLTLVAAITMGSIVGAAIGAIIILVIRMRIKNRIQRQIRQGGLLLWVRTREYKKEKIAQDIMRKHGGRHVHIHNIAW